MYEHESCSGKTGAAVAGGTGDTVATTQGNVQGVVMVSHCNLKQQATLLRRLLGMLAQARPRIATGKGPHAARNKCCLAR
jgi:hypothetical protein